MASTGKTARKGLNYWSSENDKPERADFNADNAINDLWEKAFKFANTASISVPSGTPTSLTFGSFEYAGGASAALKHIYNSVCYGIDIPAGYTMGVISAYVYFAGVSGNAGIRQIAIGVTPSGGSKQLERANSPSVETGNGISLSISLPSVFSAGDAITAEVYQNSGQTITIAIGEARMSGFIL